MKRGLLALLLMAGFCLSTTDAHAVKTQLSEDITTKEVMAVIEKAMAKAEEIKVPMNIAVVDAGGNLKGFCRMDGAFLGSEDIAIKKAKTARKFNMSTAALGAASQPGQELYGIEVTNDGLVIFGGGELIIKNNVIIGAIGVSGGSVADDTTVAKAGLSVVKQFLYLIILVMLALSFFR